MSTMYRATALLLVAFWMASAAFAPFSQPARANAPVSEIRALTVAQDPAGRLWAAWEVDDGADVDIYFSHWTGAAWAMPRPVHHRPGAWDRCPSLAVATDGTPWLAWSSAERADPRRSRLYVSRWMGHGWTSPEAVPLGDVSQAREPTLVAGPAGSLWLAWAGLDGVDDEIFASRWDGTAWSAPQQVSANDADPHLCDRQPRLAVGSDGQPWLAWTGYQPSGDSEVYVSRWAGDSWTPEQMVSRDDDDLDVWPSLTVDAQGRPWLAWTGLATNEEDAPLRIVVAHWDTDHAAWTAEAVASSSPALSVDESSPALFLDDGGGMGLAWVASSGGRAALAHARWTGEEWTAPQVVRADATAPYGRLTVIAGDDAPKLLWLDPASPGPAPVAQAPVLDSAQPLAAWVQKQASERAAVPMVAANPLPNRYLAFGDSITYGRYESYPYPTLLENRLDAEYRESEVFNEGVPGEETSEGAARIAKVVGALCPEYVLIMEGTNDISHGRTADEIRYYLRRMIDNVRKYSGVQNVRIILATIIPRTDDLNDETAWANETAVRVVAAQRGVPVCDQWQAFYDYGDWWTIFRDKVHPNQTGLQILADTFFGCIMAERDRIPPTATLNLVPGQSECSIGVQLSWSGSDPAPASGVVSYDVQVQMDYGLWNDWLSATTATTGVYTQVVYAHLYSFRVRARDRAGNVGEYSAPGTTWIADTIPPDEAHVNPLPPAQVAPFAVSWWGHDACGLMAYDVQYRAGASGMWQSWLNATPNTSGYFSPTIAQYGETYYFRARAQDVAGNWSAWSGDGEASTRLARFTLSGHVYTVRHAPVALAEAGLVPAALYATHQPGGGYRVYVADAGTYDLTVSRAGFGPAKWMRGLPVSDHVTGLDFVLAPLDDVVSDGDFEAGGWGRWQPGGTLTPTLSAEAHTGYTATLIGGAGGLSWLSQPITVTGNLTDATLSFLVRLYDDTDGSSTLHVELAGTPISHTQVVTTSDWTHVWFPVEVAPGQILTLTFTLSDTPAILLDEVSLGTAAYGGSFTYLPVVLRAGP